MKRTPSNFIDLTGMIFGYLKVIERAPDHIQPSGNHVLMWRCICMCDGNEIVTSGNSLKNGDTKSCGCLKQKFLKELNNKSKNPPYKICEDYAIGYTNKGEEFLIDIEDVSLCKQYTWSISSEGYLRAYDSNTQTNIFIHRLIMNVTNGMTVDHINHIKTDNRKSNLRIATYSQNSMNQKKRSVNTSGITGVSWFERDQNWRVQIMVNRKNIHIGYFDNLQDAIKARKEAEIKYFGEYRYDAHNSTEQNDLRSKEAM